MLLKCWFLGTYWAAPATQLHRHLLACISLFHWSTMLSLQDPGRVRYNFKIPLLFGTCKCHLNWETNQDQISHLSVQVLPQLVLHHIGGYICVHPMLGVFQPLLLSEENCEPQLDPQRWQYVIVYLEKTRNNYIIWIQCFEILVWEIGYNEFCFSGP